MVDLKDHFDTYGSKWIWIIANSGSGSPSVEQGVTYYTDLGVTFGWITNDADNSLGGYTFHNTDLNGSSVPWIGVIDAKTMRVTHSNPPDVASVVQSLATD